jgi:hypothetical protein
MSYYETDTDTLLQRVKDVRLMLDTLDDQLHYLARDCDNEDFDKHRLVAWLHLDSAWARVYQAWSALMEEEQALRDVRNP